MFPLTIRPAADADIDAIAEHIALDSDEQALRFYDSIDHTYRLIAENPLAWPICDILDHPRLLDVRRRSVIGFPNHLVFYRFDSGTIDVLRVIHGSRDIEQHLMPDTD